MEDEWNLRPLPGEPITVTFNVAELVPGTYVYLDADDEILAVGALDEADGIPPARTEFSEGDGDTDPDGRTIVGPLMAPRLPAPRRASHDDDDEPRERTIMGPLMAPRAPAPRRK